MTVGRPIRSGSRLRAYGRFPPVSGPWRQRSFKQRLSADAAGNLRPREISAKSALDSSSIYRRHVIESAPNEPLTGVVWEDDSQIEDAVVHRRYDKGNLRIVLTICESPSTADGA